MGEINSPWIIEQHHRALRIDTEETRNTVTCFEYHPIRGPNGQLTRGTENYRLTYRKTLDQLFTDDNENPTDDITKAHGPREVVC